MQDPQVTVPGVGPRSRTPGGCRPSTGGLSVPAGSARCSATGMAARRECKPPSAVGRPAPSVLPADKSSTCARKRAGRRMRRAVGKPRPPPQTTVPAALTRPADPSGSIDWWTLAWANVSSHRDTCGRWRPGRRRPDGFLPSRRSDLASGVGAQGRSRLTPPLQPSWISVPRLGDRGRAGERPREGRQGGIDATLSTHRIVRR